MERLKYVNDAVMRGVPMELQRGEFVSHMVQWLNVVITRDVTIMPRREEFASHMVLW
jgi:hypothetical protein